MEALTGQQILASGLVGWKEQDRALHASFTITDYSSAAVFIAEVAKIVDAEDHHPDLTLSYGVLKVTMCTHSKGPKVTQRDVDMARRISTIATDFGIAPKPT